VSGLGSFRLKALLQLVDWLFSLRLTDCNYFSGTTDKPDGQGDLTDLENRGIQRLADFKRKGQAYQEIQGTTPYTLGGALSCSPVAALIYIGEKVRRWSSPDTHPSDDDIIANVMIYWFTGTITSSFWLYYMRRSGDIEQHNLLEKTKIEQPFWFGCGQYEIHWPAQKVFEWQVTNIRAWKVLEKGGHFLAWEAPDVLAKDVDQAFQSEEVQNLFKKGGSKI
jgi:pimeloyl-ACP methyl ester carboxylesterase